MIWYLIMLNQSFAHFSAWSLASIILSYPSKLYTFKTLSCQVGLVSTFQNGYHQSPMLCLVVHYSLMNAYLTSVSATHLALITILASCLSNTLHSGMTSSRAISRSEYTNAFSLFRTIHVWALKPWLHLSGDYYLMFSCCLKSSAILQPI